MRERGFSLIELVVAMAVSLIAIAAGVALLIATQRSFNSGGDERAVQETARVALDEMLTHVRAAGYGLEPTFVFDTGRIANVPMDRIPLAKQARFGGYCSGTYGTCSRDSVTGSDELVFYSRDPNWERDVAGIDVNLIKMASPEGLQSGQVLQIMCYGSSNQWLWAYVTVSTVDPTSSPPQVTLRTSPGLPYDFPFQNALLTEESCFQGGTVRAFKIDRYRYYVALVDSAGAIQPAGTAGTRPYLMLDQGLSAGGKAIHQAIAPDVEDLQVAYVFSLAATGSQLLGADPTAGAVLNTTDGDDGGFNLAPANGVPTFETPSLDPLRTTHHPANVRAVRIAITVRSPKQDVSVPDAQVPAALNRPAVPGEAGYRRWVFESTGYARNMETRLPVFPTYDSNYLTNCCPATTGASCDGNCGGG